MPYDELGQPLASTLADYVMPGATEVPNIRIEHFETPSPHTEFGAKGMGEGGAIAPPAVIFGAVNDALARLGVPELASTPLTPRRLLEALAHAKATVVSAPEPVKKPKPTTKSSRKPKATQEDKS
jgi:carbon-monoxide dehydrogenase large subunit